MKLKQKKRAFILIVLGIFFAISSIYYSNPYLKATYKDKSTDYSDYFTFDRANLKISVISGKIHIDNNWTAAKIAGICKGNGTYSEPYVIEDLVIDGEGSGSCILIENSNMYFKIENCTVTNSGGLPNAGIRLDNSTNGKLINNICSYNENGISVDSNYITVSGNTANSNDIYGVIIYGNYNNLSGNTVNYNEVGMVIANGNYTTVSGNNANSNDMCGIAIFGRYNNISGNMMNDCGLFTDGSLEELHSNDIDTTNLVNGKPLYYYTNEVNLGVNDFTNAGQVILSNCNDSIISNLNVSHGSVGIYLRLCDNNIISGNTANSNDMFGMVIYGNYNDISGNTANSNYNYGISLLDSDLNTLSGNTANYNYIGIFLDHSNYNTILENIANNNDNIGISLHNSDNSDISGNIINCNNYDGIWLYNSDYNTLSGNTIFNNSNTGVIIAFGCHDNNITLNCFINNSINAYDDGSNNRWDNGIKGNYWSDYTGSDADGDGIGDVPYNIAGYAGSQDNFPLMKCPISIQDGGSIPIELIILILVISGGAIIGIATLLKLYSDAKGKKRWRK